MSEEALKLAEQFGGVWADHPEHSVADWVYLTENNDTRLSYWDWVLSEIEYEESA